KKPYLSPTNRIQFSSLNVKRFRKAFRMRILTQTCFLQMAAAGHLSFSSFMCIYTRTNININTLHHREILKQLKGTTLTSSFCPIPICRSLRPKKTNLQQDTQLKTNLRRRFSPVRKRKEIGDSLRDASLLCAAVGSVKHASEQG
ncbi:hypothetical protein O6P43_010088, partial [Quillaja saponaria]